MGPHGTEVGTDEGMSVVVLNKSVRMNEVAMLYWQVLGPRVCRTSNGMSRGHQSAWNYILDIATRARSVVDRVLYRGFGRVSTI